MFKIPNGSGDSRKVAKLVAEQKPLHGSTNLTSANYNTAEEPSITAIQDPATLAAAVIEGVVDMVVLTLVLMH